ncbi:MAG: type II toxin-antitoxin system HicB family antitoxin [Bacteroidia bacterium]|nr:type II toxin-antitoxin system HicB family antitoxin [Bacteroidia bacterium]
MKTMELTMIIEKGENDYYVGQIEEYPAALSQGKTIDELKDNLRDALKLLLKLQKKQLENDYIKRKIVKRRLLFAQ